MKRSRTVSTWMWMIVMQVAIAVFAWASWGWRAGAMWFVGSAWIGGRVTLASRHFRVQLFEVKDETDRGPTILDWTESNDDVRGRSGT